MGLQVGLLVVTTCLLATFSQQRSFFAVYAQADSPSPASAPQPIVGLAPEPSTGLAPEPSTGLAPQPTTAVTPPPSPPPPSPPPPPAAFTEYLTLRESLIAVLDQNTTLDALNATRLDVAIANLVNVTLLAPQDSAWENYDSQPRGAQLKTLLNGTDKDLVLFNLLLYHTLSQYQLYSDLQSTTSGQGLPTLLNRPVFTTVQEGQSYFYTNSTNASDNSTLSQPDLDLGGIISVLGISAVLIPLDTSLLLTPRPGLVPFVPEPIASPPPPTTLAPSTNAPPSSATSTPQSATSPPPSTPSGAHSYEASGKLMASSIALTGLLFIYLM